MNRRTSTTLLWSSIHSLVPLIIDLDVDDMDRPNSQRTLSLFHFPDLNEVSFSSFPLLNDEVDNVLAYMLPYEDKEVMMTTFQMYYCLILLSLVSTVRWKIMVMTYETWIHLMKANGISCNLKCSICVILVMSIVMSCWSLTSTSKIICPTNWPGLE